MDYFYWLYVLCVLFIKTASSQFQAHVDLQKVGRVKFQGEYYNVLKPTVHEVTDHFKDFMLRQNTHTDERVFIDDDGFRHHWKGFGLRKNLRKNDKDIEKIVKHTQVDRADPEYPSNEVQGLPIDAATYLRQKATTKKGAATTKKAAGTTKKAAGTTKKAAASTKKAAGTTKAPAATTKAPAATTNAPAATTIAPAETTIAPAATTKAPAATTKSPDKAEAARTRTAAKTYFFCPFFGVITMKGFID